MRRSIVVVAYRDHDHVRCFLSTERTAAGAFSTGQRDPDETDRVHVLLAEVTAHSFGVVITEPDCH
jgi:hypothetical protein